jgi:hypothetical protein
MNSEERKQLEAEIDPLILDFAQGKLREMRYGDRVK